MSFGNDRKNSYTALKQSESLRNMINYQNIMGVRGKSESQNKFIIKKNITVPSFLYKETPKHEVQRKVNIASIQQQNSLLQNKGEIAKQQKQQLEKVNNQLEKEEEKKKLSLEGEDIKDGKAGNKQPILIPQCNNQSNTNCQNDEQVEAAKNQVINNRNAPNYNNHRNQNNNTSQSLSRISLDNISQTSDQNVNQNCSISLKPNNQQLEYPERQSDPQNTLSKEMGVASKRPFVDTTDSIPQIEKLFEKIQIQNEELHKKCDQGYNQLHNLIDQVQILPKIQDSIELAAQLDNIRILILQLLTHLENSSKNEIDLSHKSNEVLKLKSVINELTIQNQKLHDRVIYLSNENEALIKGKAFLLDDATKQKQLLEKTKELYNSEQKKVGTLEKRLQFIIQSDYVNYNSNQKNGNNKDNEHLGGNLNSTNSNFPNSNNNTNTNFNYNYFGGNSGLNERQQQKIFTELVQENDALKQRFETVKNNNQHLNQTLIIQTDKYNRLFHKFELMKKKISQKILEQVKIEQISDRMKYEQVNQVNPLDILKNYEIPPNLEFRLSTLSKLEHSHQLGELADQGSAEFAGQILKSKNKNQQFESIQLVASQYLSFKEMGNQLIQVINVLAGILSLQNIEDIILFISKQAKGTFLAERTQLWLLEEDIGVLYTLQDNPKLESRVIFNKGIIGEVLKSQRPINKKEREEIILGLSSNLGENQVIRVKSTLCIPIYYGESRSKIFGILEISNSKNSNFSYDEQCLGIILAKFINQKISQLQHEFRMQSSIRYMDYLQESYFELLYSENLQNFFKTAKKWIKKIFIVEQFKLYIANQQQHLVTWGEENSTQTYPINCGVAGYCLLSGKPLICQNIKTDEHYDERVDINTIMTVHIYPIGIKPDKQSEFVNLGVIEVIQKKNFHSDKFNFKDNSCDVETKNPGIECYSFEIILEKLVRNLAIVIQRLLSIIQKETQKEL